MISHGYLGGESADREATVDDDRFQMLYCDNPACRVNTFERGELTSYRRVTGRCPGCYKIGEVVR